MKVLVVGAGLMGSQIGCEYALGGHEVVFVTRSSKRGRSRVRAALDFLAGEGLASKASLDAARANVHFPREVYGPVELIVEALPEDLAVKVAALRGLAQKFPRAIIATNTSSLSVTKLGDSIGASQRTIGTHYWNPPLLMPLVEVVSGEQTEPDVCDFVWETLSELGKRPVRVARDIPGFVWNRLQVAVLREAIWLVERGVVSASELDLIVRDGLARRCRHVGPFETVALGGVSTWRDVTRNLAPELSSASDFDIDEEWLDALSAQTLRARRDAALAEELRRERDQITAAEARR